MITQEDILVLLKNAIVELYKNDEILLKKEYDIHERTIVHRLAIYIEKNLKVAFDVDIEYNRMRTSYEADDIGDIIGKSLNWEDSEEGSSYVYPDIIIHKRDKGENLVDIEVKLSWKNTKKNNDYKKINAYLNQLNYKYGVYIELDEIIDNCKIEFGPFKLLASH